MVNEGYAFIKVQYVPQVQNVCAFSEVGRELVTGTVTYGIRVFFQCSRCLFIN